MRPLPCLFSWEQDKQQVLSNVRKTLPGRRSVRRVARALASLETTRAFPLSPGAKSLNHRLTPPQQTVEQGRSPPGLSRSHTSAPRLSHRHPSPASFCASPNAIRARLKTPAFCEIRFLFFVFLGGGRNGNDLRSKCSQRAPGALPRDLRTRLPFHPHREEC